MEEYQLMWSRLNPSTWSWPKIAIIAFGIIAIVGIWQRRRPALHIPLQATAYLGLCLVFAYGVMTRGALGTSLSHPHTLIYYVILILHVAFALVYMFGGLIQFLSGINRLKRQPVKSERKRLTILSHTSLGWICIVCLICAILLLLPL